MSFHRCPTEVSLRNLHQNIVREGFEVFPIREPSHICFSSESLINCDVYIKFCGSLDDYRTNKKGNSPLTIVLINETWQMKTVLLLSMFQRKFRFPLYQKF
ncbi:hypothetical protein HHI36_020558 [Cryptolaemus montrouzieri]|uniref:Uncharacterized protein n=1 Tax=Cryptolaemus montrouzieri TaxID=559131 RepID=A0ABD2NB35_9CUCU